MGFIEEYSQLILEHIPTHPLWAESCALTILSTVLGRDRVIVTKKGKLHLNLYYMYIGPSGIAHKSLPMDQFIRPFLELASTDKTDLLLPSLFSTEGMITHLASNSRQGCIIRDEVTALFKESLGKPYLTTEMEFYSDLYDGRPIKRTTRKTGLEYIRDCFVTVITATTPYLYTVLRDQFFRQGTGNRFLYILPDDGMFKAQRDDDEYFVQPDNYMIDQQIKEFVVGLIALRDSQFTWALPLDDAQELLLDFKYQVDQETEQYVAENPLDWYGSYRARCHEFSLKLAALKCFSDDWKQAPSITVTDSSPITGKTLDALVVSKKQAQWAIRQVEKHWKYFLQMRSEFAKFMQSRSFITEREPLQAVLMCIEGRGEEGISRSDLLRMTQLKSRDLTELLNTLLEQKLVVAREVKTKGRPGVVYTAVHHSSSR